MKYYPASSNLQALAYPELVCFNLFMHAHLNNLVSTNKSQMHKRTLILKSTDKCIWPGNATITDHRPTHGTTGKRHRTAIRIQPEKNIYLPTPYLVRLSQTYTLRGLFKYECKWLHNFLHIYATSK